MFKISQLDEAFKQSLSVVNFRGGFDTFLFRKGFKESFLSEKQRTEILDYVKTNIDDNVYINVKTQIDEQESLITGYYSNPQYSSIRPRKFRGAYAPVVYQTFAGLMEFSLLQQIEQ